MENGQNKEEQNQIESYNTEANQEAWISQGEETLYKTYNRFPVVFERGEGLHLYDTDGKEYLDFFAGIAVNALGYGDEEYTEYIKEQAGKLLHISNYFYNTPSIKAGEKLLKASQMDKVFFTNSGTEAIEGALKIARRYGFNKGISAEKSKIIAMKNSFHGRSLGALSVTGNDHYQEPFKPLIPGICFADFNDLDSVKALMDENTCAVIMETVQGEGGIYPASEAFITGVRALCDQYDALLILDEIQCGMGRTGKMFAWQHYPVKPDVMTTHWGTASRSAHFWPGERQHRRWFRATTAALTAEILLLAQRLRRFWISLHQESLQNMPKRWETIYGKNWKK